MAANTDYIPRADNEFDDFQAELNAQVSANGVAWNIPPAKVTELQNNSTDYHNLYTPIINEITRSRQQVIAHRQGRIFFEAYLRACVGEYLIKNSAITYEQKIAMGLNPDEGGAGFRPAIETSPWVLLKALGGSRVRVECRVESDSSRPSRHPDSDGVEFRALIGTTPPATWKDAPQVYFSTKARFTVELDPTDAGKIIYGFARWKNNTDPAKSGPWCAIVQVMIAA